VAGRLAPHLVRAVPVLLRSRGAREPARAVPATAPGGREHRRQHRPRRGTPVRVHPDVLRSAYAPRGLRPSAPRTAAGDRLTQVFAGWQAVPVDSVRRAVTDVFARPEFRWEPPRHTLQWLQERWRTASSRWCSSSSGRAPFATTRPRRPPSTSAKRGSIRRAAPRWPDSSAGCTATCSAPCRATSPAISSSAPRPMASGSMSYKTEIGLALFLAVAITVAIVAGRSAPKPLSEDQPPSTLLTGPGGTKAAYEVLARLGVAEERLRRPLFDLMRDARHRPALLVVVAPPLGLEPAELDQVVDFVRGGGEVVAASRGGG